VWIGGNTLIEETSDMEESHITTTEPVPIAYKHGPTTLTVYLFFIELLHSLLHFLLSSL